MRAAEDYEWLLGSDVARELARIDLPLSTYTQWYWKIDLHNLLHFLTLRADPHAQYEIRAFARVMAGMLKRVAPLSYEAWIDYGFSAAPMSRAELATLRRSDCGRTRRRGRRHPDGPGRRIPRYRRTQGPRPQQAGRSPSSSRSSRPPRSPEFDLDLSSMRTGGGDGGRELPHHLDGHERVHRATVRADPPPASPARSPHTPTSVCPSPR
jgi:hypothetical protein